MSDNEDKKFNILSEEIIIKHEIPDWEYIDCSHSELTTEHFESQSINCEIDTNVHTFNEEIVQNIKVEPQCDNENNIRNLSYERMVISNNIDKDNTYNSQDTQNKKNIIHQSNSLMEENVIPYLKQNRNNINIKKEPSEQKVDNSYVSKSENLENVNFHVMTPFDNLINTDRDIDVSTLQGDIDIKDENLDDCDDDDFRNTNEPEYSEKQLYKCIECDKVFRNEKYFKLHGNLHINPFKCDMCDKTFAQEYYLVLHRRIHTTDKQFECSICKKRYIDSKSLNRHQKLHVDRELFKCETCGVSLKTKDSYRKHIKLHDRLFECNTCNAKFVDNRTLYQHELMHLSPKSSIISYKCGICDKTFKSKYYAKVHQKRHDDLNESRMSNEEFKEPSDPNLNNKQLQTSDNSHECKNCNKLFNKDFDETHTENNINECEICHGNDTEHLVQSESTRIKNKRYECTLCNKKFFQKIKLQKHLAAHEGKKPFKCNFCNKGFNSKYSFRIHQRLHTNEKPFGCEICDDRFISKKHLKKHLRNNHESKNEATYKCDKCELTFKTKDYYTMHQEVHDKTYECKECNRCFIKQSIFLKHQLKHTNNSKYECDICKKLFPRPGELARHQRFHSGIKPFECDTCYQKFALKCTLKKHKLQHTGEKPYQCEICYKKFTRKFMLDEHGRSHIGIKPYECGICHRKYTRKSQMQKHEKNCVTNNVCNTI